MGMSTRVCTSPLCAQPPPFVPPRRPAGWCGPCSPDKEIGARKSVSGKKINNKNSIFQRYKIECQRVCIPPLRDEGRKGRKAMIVSAGS